MDNENGYDYLEPMRERQKQMSEHYEKQRAAMDEIIRLSRPDTGVPRITEYVRTDPADPGVKFDADKPRWGLLPWRQVQDVVKVLTLGAKKYPSADNWQKVPDAENRYFDALMRHVYAWVKGEKMDPESGLPHLAHAVCNVLFIMWFDDHKKEGLQ